MSLLPHTALRLIESAVPDLQAVYVFGSAAAGEARPDSDLDLAVLAAQPLDPLARWTLQEDLAAHLHTDVDLVDLHAASTVLRRQVIATGAVVLDRQPPARQRFEMHALAMYADLAIERRAILEDIRARGRVYGDAP